METTQIQDEVVAALEKRGFRINDTISGNEDGAACVLLSRKRKSTTHYAEVEADGLVNGTSLATFLLGCN